MEDRIIAFVVLVSARHRLPGLTKHLRNGCDVSTQIASLQLVAYEDDPGVYLLYLDGKGVVLNDTYHTSQDAAKSQAAYEFGVNTGDWVEGEGAEHGS